MQSENLRQAGDQTGAIGLVDAVLHGFAQQIEPASREGGDEQTDALKVEDGVGAGIGLRQCRASVPGGKLELRNDDDCLQRTGRGGLHGKHVSLIGLATDDNASKNGGGDVVRVALDFGGLLQQCVAGKVQVGQLIGEHETGDDGGGAAAQATAERDIVVDLQSKIIARRRSGHRLERTPDEVRGIGGNAVWFGTRNADCQSAGGGSQGAFQIEGQGHAQRVKTGTEVGAAGRNLYANLQWSVPVSFRNWSENYIVP